MAFHLAFKIHVALKWVPTTLLTLSYFCVLRKKCALATISSCSSCSSVFVLVFKDISVVLQFQWAFQEVSEV